ncbi:hypothetical protein [Citreimonas sp.]|uniref:hypothetical protein n=1 Tax=Citreimonas sp. TaxID=3036715 RepID=UPI0040584AE0
MSTAVTEFPPAPDRVRGWYLHRDGGRTVLARHWPPRFDVAAGTEFPPLRAVRLAHQVRQDVWRAFQRLRGFSPVVQVDATDTGLSLIAGGRTSTPVPPAVQARLVALLNDPRLRTRWIACASRGAA